MMEALSVSACRFSFPRLPCFGKRRFPLHSRIRRRNWFRPLRNPKKQSLTVTVKALFNNIVKLSPLFKKRGSHVKRRHFTWTIILKKISRNGSGIKREIWIGLSRGLPADKGWGGRILPIRSMVLYRRAGIPVYPLSKFYWIYWTWWKICNFLWSRNNGKLPSRCCQS